MRIRSMAAKHGSVCCNIGEVAAHGRNDIFKGDLRDQRSRDMVVTTQPDLR